MLASQSKDFSKWYNQVVLDAGLAEYSSIKGCMVIKPYGYAIWENMKNILDGMIKDLGVDNVYFPLFIPESFLKKEAEHVEGFDPEVAWVTQGGGKELGERLALRPTSETVMYDTFSKWIQSHRDLPLKVNQWANIIRWEKRTRLFLRTLEFLWQEGHTVHADERGAEEMTNSALAMYEDFIKNHLAIHTIPGRKSDAETFAGADYTLSVESLMLDGKGLQMGTSHNLGQNFAKSFDIKFLDEKEEQKYAWQTSWGVSTRMVGALIMAHGDDKGLVLPPRIAPYQVVVVPIWKDNKEKKNLEKYISSIERGLSEKGIKFFVDWREQQTPGWKFNDWELKGAPLRLEIGPNEVEEKKVTFVLRDDLKKKPLALDKFLEDAVSILSEMQKRLLKRSEEFVKDNTRVAESYSDLKKIISEYSGFVEAFWCGDEKCEAEIKEETKATIRNIPFGSGGKGKCVKCGKKSGHKVLFAKAY
ncbi:MAG: proline--tRNA ligase [Candidatus Portnoybacteria bacterium]|nr:proline--tRNA ligase [Candidatus Portnoybacteria bacterium]